MGYVWVGSSVESQHSVTVLHSYTLQPFTSPDVFRLRSRYQRQGRASRASSPSSKIHHYKQAKCTHMHVARHGRNQKNQNQQVATRNLKCGRRSHIKQPRIGTLTANTHLSHFTRACTRPRPRGLGSRGRGEDGRTTWRSTCPSRLLNPCSMFESLDREGCRHQAVTRPSPGRHQAVTRPLSGRYQAVLL